MSRKRTPKAKTMKLLDEAAMTYRTVHLFNVTIETRNVVTKAPVGNCVVQVYAPSEKEIAEVATRLYVNKGAFGSIISFERA